MSITKKVLAALAAFVAVLGLSLMTIDLVDYLVERYHYGETSYERVNRIYQEVYVHTGRSGEIPPLTVINSEDINAYVSDREMVIYTGMIDFAKNDDELALVLGHEMAHVTLGHLSTKANSTSDVSVMESMADKMGAYYMLAAGYDVCKARDMWKRLKAQEGDYMNKDHPDMAYRYDQLNVGCE